MAPLFGSLKLDWMLKVQPVVGLEETFLAWTLLLLLRLFQKRNGTFLGPQFLNNMSHDKVTSILFYNNNISNKQ